MLVLISCTTCPRESIKKNESFYIPNFPDPFINGVSVVDFEINTNNEVKTVKLPYWYWLEIVNYASAISELEIQLQ